MYRSAYHCHNSNNGNDDIALYEAKLSTECILAHGSYDDESLTVLSFNLESLIHVNEQSSYQLGIAAFRQDISMRLNDFVSIFI